jgi:hypothetical protein
MSNDDSHNDNERKFTDEELDKLSKELQSMLEAQLSEHAASQTPTPSVNEEYEPPAEIPLNLSMIHYRISMFGVNAWIFSELDAYVSFIEAYEALAKAAFRDNRFDVSAAAMINADAWEKNLMSPQTFASPLAADA